MIHAPPGSIGKRWACGCPCGRWGAAACLYLLVAFVGSLVLQTCIDPFCADASLWVGHTPTLTVDVLEGAFGLGLGLTAWRTSYATIDKNSDSKNIAKIYHYICAYRRDTVVCRRPADKGYKGSSGSATATGTSALSAPIQYQCLGVMNI